MIGMLDTLADYLTCLLFASVRIAVFFAGWIALLMAVPIFLQFR